MRKGYQKMPIKPPRGLLYPLGGFFLQHTKKELNLLKGGGMTSKCREVIKFFLSIYLKKL